MHSFNKTFFQAATGVLLFFILLLYLYTCPYSRQSKSIPLALIFPAVSSLHLAVHSGVQSAVYCCNSLHLPSLLLPEHFDVVSGSIQLYVFKFCVLYAEYRCYLESLSRSVNQTKVGSGACHSQI